MVYLLQDLLELSICLRIECLRICITLHNDFLHVFQVIRDLLDFFDQLGYLIILLLAHFYNFLSNFDLQVLDFCVQWIETRLLHYNNFINIRLRNRNLFLQFLLHFRC